MINVNAHLHTPYSFSAFGSIAEALERAKSEGVGVAGINDFYSTEGYVEWGAEAAKRGIYPLYGIEFIALDADNQLGGVRVNDPNNPGRTYLSGKGLCSPASMSERSAAALNSVRSESNAQTRQMTGRLNSLLLSIDAGFTLDYDAIRNTMTKGLVRERHLAKALRQNIYHHFGGDGARIAEFMTLLFGGKPLKADISNEAAVENQIRSELLKAGGAAFVPEDKKAFLPVEQVCEIVLDAGGIPTYPFLADDAKGGFTDFEANIERAADWLAGHNIWSAEFITTRNSPSVLERYASALVDRGMVVTFGSEHNTPAMEPVLLSTRGGEPLSDRLRQINFEGGCIVAAHQSRVARGEQGFVDRLTGRPTGNRDAFVAEGRALIESVVNG